MDSLSHLMSAGALPATNVSRTWLRGTLFRLPVLFCCLMPLISSVGGCGANHHPMAQETYQAYALLRVSATPPRLLSRGSTAPMDPAEFETFQRTQAALITSGRILRSAIDRDDTRTLNIVSRHHPDTDWLSERVTVDFPGKSEVMRIGVWASNASDATCLVNAITDAYLAHVIEIEQRDREYVRGLLEQKYTKNHQLIQSKRFRIKEVLLQSHDGRPAADSSVEKDQLARLQVEHGQLRLALVGTERNLLQARSKMDQLTDAGDEFEAAIEKLKLAEEVHELVLNRLESVQLSITNASKPLSQNESLELEDKRAELDQLRQANNVIGAEINLLELEDFSPPRVTLIEQARLP